MTSSKKIFRLCSRLNIGGPSLHVVNLAITLEEYGYQTKLLVGVPSVSEGSMNGYAIENGVDLEIISSLRPRLSFYHDFISLIKLVILFRKHKPDIVHTHTFKAGLLGRLAAFLTGVPFVAHTYHGHLFSGYAGPIKTQILLFIERTMAKITDEIITLSPKLKHDLLQVGLCRPEKISLVELGFDMKRFVKQVELPSRLRQDLKIDATDQVVAVIGRLVPIKSIDLFLRALSPLLKTHSRLHLIIIGDGEERASLEKLAQSLDHDQSRIHFCGWRHSILADLKDLDVVVCSSKNEGTSVAIIEALAAGIPVVSTDVGGMSDLLGHGQWGSLVSYDEKPLRLAVDTILADSDASLRAQKNAPGFQERFSRERLAFNLSSVYEKAFHQRSDMTRNTDAH